MGTESFPKSGKRSKMKSSNAQLADKRLSRMGAKVACGDAQPEYDRIYGNNNRKATLGDSQYPTAPDPAFDDAPGMGLGMGMRLL